MTVNNCVKPTADSSVGMDYSLRRQVRSRGISPRIGFDTRLSHTAANCHWEVTEYCHLES